MVRYRVIAAMARESRGIGIKGRLPWPKLRGDMDHFRKLTLGGVVVVGRVTFEGIGVLADRTFVILSREPRKTPDGGRLHFASSLEEADHKIKHLGFETANIIGGQQIFEQALADPKYSDQLHLTLINSVSECDRFFPQVHPYGLHQVSESVPVEEKGLQYVFTEWTRQKND